MQTWLQHIGQLNRLLKSVQFTGAGGAVMAVDKGFAIWRTLTLQLRRRRRTVYLIGNGASASMASHFAADLAKNAGLHTQVFSDLSLITAMSNDMGYQHVFAEPLRRRGRKGDMLVAISSSGKSPNILAAADVARKLGMTVVTLSAMRAGNPLRTRGDLNLHVSARTYGQAETAHAAALHWWLDLVQQSEASHG